MYHDASYPRHTGLLKEITEKPAMRTPPEIGLIARTGMLEERQPGIRDE
jgi:hypothetical protein